MEIDNVLILMINNIVNYILFHLSDNIKHDVDD